MPLLRKAISRSESLSGMWKFLYKKFRYRNGTSRRSGETILSRGLLRQAGYRRPQDQKKIWIGYWEIFFSGKTDILIGTQLVAKGLDFENVGLVGIIAADTGLNIPDYRSCERTFQLITQAAGRAGRREQRGRVIIQTYEPDNYALRAASSNDYGEFFRQEIKLRKFMEYPPFTDMIMVNFTAEDEENAFRTAKRCKKYLENSGEWKKKKQAFWDRKFP